MLIPFPYQTGAIDNLRAARGLGKRRLLLCMLMGAGKAQPMQSRIYTPHGWICMGALNIGDEVINPCGGTSRVTGIFPQGKKKVVQMTFRDGSSTDCCLDHLWYVNRPHRRYAGLPGFVMSVREILEQGLIDKVGNCKWFIPMTAPVDFTPNEPTTIDPYLLGVLIGDGCLRHGVVQLSTADEEMIERILPLLPKELKPRRGKNAYDWALSRPNSGGKTNPLTKELEKLLLMETYSNTKFIPQRYLFGTASERIAMLQGLLDTDGSITDRATIEFTTVSKRLSREFYELVQSLGGTATCQERTTHYTHKEEYLAGQLSYRIHFKLPPQIEPFRLTRKAKRHVAATKYPPSRALISVDEIGEEYCQCITVDSPEQLYVTDNFIVTHNTLVALKLMHLSSEKGRRCLFLNDRRMLVDQVVERAQEEGLETGTILSGRGHNLKAPCQFASKQTMESWLARNKIDLPPFDLVIIDEAHRAVSPKWLKLFSLWPAATFIGLTATPCLGNGNGMGHYYDYLCQPIKPSALREMERIVPVRAFAPHIPNLKGVKKDANGDYAAKSLSERMNRKNLIGDVCGWWKKLGENRASVYFACDVAHAMSIRDEFRSQDVPAELICDETPDEEREEIREKLKSGKIKVVVNCDVLAEGVDWPFVSLIGLVRPTKRLRRYLQNSGRGMRACEGKKDCLIIDHAGCVLYHGFPDADIEWPLSPDDNVDKSKSAKKSPGGCVKCAKCNAVFTGTRVCPECGHLNAWAKKTQPKDYAQGNGTLVEVNSGDLPKETASLLYQRYWGMCIGVAIKRGAKAGLAAKMFSDKFGIPPWNAGVKPLADFGGWKEFAADVFPGFVKSRV